MTKQLIKFKGDCSDHMGQGGDPGACDKTSNPKVTMIRSQLFVRSIFLQSEWENTDTD